MVYWVESCSQKMKKKALDGVDSTGVHQQTENSGYQLVID
jgi:hypothetical protein